MGFNSAFKELSRKWLPSLANRSNESHKNLVPIECLRSCAPHDLCSLWNYKKLEFRNWKPWRKEQKESARNTRHSDTNRPAAVAHNSVTSVTAIFT